MLRPEVRHIFRLKRLTNLQLGTLMENEDPYHRQEPWPPRSKVKFVMSHGASDKSRERKFPEIPKLGWQEGCPPYGQYCAPVSGQKGQRSRSAGKPKVYYIYEAGRPTNFKIGMPIEHAIESAATASYKGLWSWVLARGRGHTNKGVSARVEMNTSTKQINWSQKYSLVSSALPVPKLERGQN